MVEAEMLDFEEDKNIINEKQKNNLLDKYSQYIKVKIINLILEEIQNIDFNQSYKITQLDRLAISDYLNRCFSIQFENVKNLKSFEVLKQCMV